MEPLKNGAIKSSLEREVQQTKPENDIVMDGMTFNDLASWTDEDLNNSLEKLQILLAQMVEEKHENPQTKNLMETFLIENKKPPEEDIQTMKVRETEKPSNYFDDTEEKRLLRQDATHMLLKSQLLFKKPSILQALSSLDVGTGNGIDISNAHYPEGHINPTCDVETGSPNLKDCIINLGLDEALIKQPTSMSCESETGNVIKM